MKLPDHIKSKSRDLHLEFANRVYDSTHDESKMTPEEIKNRRDQIPTLGIVPWDAAFEQGYAKGVEAGFDAWEKRDVEAKGLAEALEFYADKENWDPPNTLPSPSLWDDGYIETGQRATKALKEFKE